MAIDNKAIARSYLEDVWNDKRIERIDDLVTDTFTDHHYPSDYPLGPEGAKRWFTLVRTAFPDIHCEINDIIAEGDKVMVQYILSGTHQGEFAGIPASGRFVSVEAVSIYKISGGKIAESWVISGLMADLLKK